MLGMFSCKPSSDAEVKDAKENLAVAQTQMDEAQANKDDAAKAKESDDWKNFKHESDSAITSMENELQVMEDKIKKSGKSEQKQMQVNYDKSKKDIQQLKDKLDKKNSEFQEDIKSFNQKVVEKNQSFKRELKHDMDALGQSMKDLFKDNVK